MKNKVRLGALMLATVAVACGKTSGPQGDSSMPSNTPTTFADDLALLRAHTDVVVLAAPDGGAQIAVVPAYQGRVMTSTAAGLQGPSFGYIHRPGVEAGTRQPHMTVLGGEDRFWLGPEGGQYALYFPPGAAFDPDHWQVPEPIDWDSWPVKTQGDHDVSFERDMTLTNYAGTRFSIHVSRAIRLLDRTAIADALGVSPGGSTHVVAYQSENQITNASSTAWKKDTGLVSIWILGMYRPAPQTTVIVPFVPGPEAQLGPVVNDKYFGAIGADRLRVGDRALFFKADGQKRGKIGLPRPRARDVAGSYDPVGKVLTIVRFTLPGDEADYVNSMWERQAHPFSGDVVNSYNDGPLSPGGAPMGPFYEIESSSPAAALAPRMSLQHVHRTFHLQGPEAELDSVAKAVLGVSLGEIK